MQSTIQSAQRVVLTSVAALFFAAVAVCTAAPIIPIA
jgi:hypothetical protein